MNDLILEKSGPIATLTLNRPEKRNAMTLEMWRRIPEIIEGVEEDVEIRVLLVTGGSHFSAGADIGEFETVRKGSAGGKRYNESVEAAEQAIAQLGIPTVAVIRGFCIGGGCELALACDLRLAADTARFAITPARIGLVYSMTGTRRLVEVVGPAWAKQMLFTAEQISAAEALRIGFLNEIHPEAALDGRALEIARAMATGARTSVSSSKAIIGRILAGQTDPADPAIHALYEVGYASRDYAEGVAAFLEKRPPVFE